MKDGYKKQVFITGASSGIGKACALLFAQNGYQVTGVSRHCKEGTKSFEGGGSLTMQRLDVTDEEAVADFVAGMPGIDIAVLSAGYGIGGSVEDIPMDQVRAQMEVLYFATVNLCRQMLPKMREQGGGYIIQIGSVAGRVSIPMQAHYSAAKYALEAYIDALRLEMEPYGIRATIVEPGDTRTAFTDSRKTFYKEGSVHNEQVRRSIETMERDERNGYSAAKVAGVVYALCRKKNPPARVAVGLKYKGAVLLVKFLPDRMREKIIRGIYIKTEKKENASE